MRRGSKRSALLLMVALASGCTASGVPTDPRAASVPATYYIRPTGHDGNAGTTPHSAWRTTERLNQAVLAPGDRVLFEGGAVFHGPIEIDARDAGTAQRPVVITSFGRGRATIAAGTGRGLNAYNTAGFRVENLDFLGAGPLVNDSNGIVIYTDLPGDTKLDYVHLENVRVSGFGGNGIQIGGWNGRTGFRDVRLVRVDAMRNGNNGILVFGEDMYANERVHVSRSRAAYNSGRADATRNSGSGIVLGSVDGGMIERSVARGNGWRHGYDREGPVGIWTYDSRRIVIQDNRSIRNRTGGRTDGGGFDLDQNVSESVIQRNFSYGNDGAGILLAHGPAEGKQTANIVRHNVSRNDARKNASGALHIWGRVTDARIYGNLFELSPARGAQPSLIHISPAAGTGHADGVAIVGNVFRSRGDVPFFNRTPEALAGDIVICCNRHEQVHGPGLVHAALQAGVR